jgi:hypothetical protein
MGLSARKRRIDVPAVSRPRKAKFQADLAPAEERTVRLLKEELQLHEQLRLLVRRRCSVSLGSIRAETGAPDYQ